MDLKNDIQKMMLQKVKDEVKPAIGCTEPVAVAFAVATARRHFEGRAESIIVKPSLSVYKKRKIRFCSRNGESAAWKWPRPWAMLWTR